MSQSTVIDVIPEWGWIGVDFDGTLAKYDKWVGPTHAGDPIMPMVEFVQELLRRKREVRIFTARIWPILHVPPEGEWVWETREMKLRHLHAAEAAKFLRLWTFTQFQQVLPLTCVKDSRMTALFDDRAYHVIANTGNIVLPPGA